MTQSEKTQGLTCPNCQGVVPVTEGDRIVTCPFCEMRSLVQGERGVRRWQIRNRVERDSALNSVKGFFSGMRKARDLKRTAEIKDMFLVYLPYWRVEAYVAGWMFGRVKSGEKSTRPVEVEIAETMHWNDAAVDVAEFGVHRVTISKGNLEPYDSELLHAEAMVFEPAESRTEAIAESEAYFKFIARSKRSLKSKFYEKFHNLRQRLSFVYYPLWVARYTHRERNYQVVVDGVSGKVIYGKAPGNIFYRAAALVAGMALGNLILVDGTALALTLVSNSDDGDGLAILLFPIGIGIGMIVAGYRAFRYGEEIEEIDHENQKAVRASMENGAVTRFYENTKGTDFLKTGLAVLEELSELSD